MIRFIILILFFISTTVYAQPGPGPGEGEMPIDGFTGLLIAIGLGFGIKFLKGNKKDKK